MNFKECLSIVNTFFLQNKYIFTCPTKLKNNTKDLLFVNSTIKTFQHLIYNNELISEKYYCIQPSFRTHNLKIYEDSTNKNLFQLSFFNSIGTFQEGIISERILRDILLLLIKNIGINSENLVVILPKEYSIYSHIVEEFLEKKNIKITTNKQLTSWKYGNDDISGVGILFYYKKEDYYVSLGDIIQISNSVGGKKYVEFGTSIENILSVVNDKSIILCSEIADSVFKRENLVYSKDTEIFLDCLLAIINLVNDGIGYDLKRKNSRYAYVLKRYMKFLIVYSNNIGIGMERLICILDMYINSLNKEYISSYIQLEEISIKSNLKKFKHLYLNNRLKEDNARSIAFTRFGLLKLQVNEILECEVN